MKTKEQIKRIWIDVLKRCGIYPRKSKDTARYSDCTMDDRFRNFDNFYKWYVSQEGWDKDYEIDKDYVVKGNKVYGPDTCILIPKVINTAIVKSYQKGNDLPTGIDYRESTNRYRVRCRYTEFGVRKRKDLGYFDTLEESMLVYKNFKEQCLRNLALEYKDKISEKAFNAVYNYKI